MDFPSPDRMKVERSRTIIPRKRQDRQENARAFTGVH
jgi:hypothetical protein